MAFSQGTVIIARDPYESADSGKRPFVILNNNSHPLHGRQYVAVAMSTQRHDGSVPVPKQRWERGAPERRSFAQPWSVTSILAEDVYDCVGRLHDEALEDVSSAAFGYLQPDAPEPPDTPYS